MAAANEFLASLERASLSSPPKGPAPKPEAQPSAGDFLAATAKSPVQPPAAPADLLPDQSNADEFLARLSPPAARAQPHVQSAVDRAKEREAAGKIQQSGAPPPASSAADFLAAGAPPSLAPAGSAADFIASSNPNPNPTPARGTSAAEFLASTDGQRQASDHDPAALELQAQRNAQRAVLFWSGGLCRTVFRGWQLATRLGQQARQAGQQLFELYVGVEAVRFEAPQLEWLHEERITRLFLELHPLVTARPLQSEAVGVPPVSAAGEGRPAELLAPVEETVELVPGTPPAEMLRAALGSAEAGACVVYISLHGATSRKVASTRLTPNS
jgi:hypothetical protein